MDNLHVRLMFDLGKENKSILTARKRTLKISKNAKLVNVIKYAKYSLAKFENYIYICIMTVVFLS